MDEIAQPLRRLEFFAEYNHFGGRRDGQAMLRGRPLLAARRAIPVHAIVAAVSQGKARGLFAKAIVDARLHVRARSSSATVSTWLV